MSDLIRSSHCAQALFASGPVLWGLALSLSLVGCGSTERMVVSSIPQDDYQIRHPIVLGEAPRTLEILVEPQSGRFDRHSALQLREFAALYRKFGRGPITVSPPAFPSTTPSVQPIRQALEGAGVRAHIIVAPYPAGPNLAAPVRLSFLGLKASVADKCGQWPRDIGIGSGAEADWSNKPYWNFGCAYQTAFAAQVADPRDLVSPQAEGPQDTAMRTRAIDNREQGLDPSTWRPNTSSISGIGGNIQ
ncbi:MAG TPA: CpaD family pilus assembly protein [Methylocella sp.]|nr:CpaD family pilus assembly protein [Methylocella sp.]